MVIITSGGSVNVRGNEYWNYYTRGINFQAMFTVIYKSYLNENYKFSCTAIRSFVYSDELRINKTLFVYELHSLKYGIWKSRHFLSILYVVSVDDRGNFSSNVSPRCLSWSWWVLMSAHRCQASVNDKGEHKSISIKWKCRDSPTDQKEIYN